MTSRLIDALAQMLGDDGSPIAGAQLRFLVAGSTGTTAFQDTFSDINLSNPNANPLPLEAGGRVPNVFAPPLFYRIRYENGDGSLIKEADYVGGPQAEGEFSAWNNEQVYSVDQITYYGGKFYRSTQNGNQSNAPDASPQWAELDLPEKYSATVTYGLHKLVYDGGIVYVSQQASNTGNPPLTSHAWWQRVNNIPHWGASTAYRTYDYTIDAAGHLQKAAANSTGSNPTTPSTNWNQVHEEFLWNSARTYPTGAIVWRGGYRYFSQQNANLNNDPAADAAFVWWKPDWQAFPEFVTVNTISGGGALKPYFANIITDGNAGYTLPLANTVPNKGWIVVAKSDIARTLYPIITASGGDTIAYLGGTDTSFQIDTQFADSMILFSNGTNQWSF